MSPGRETTLTPERPGHLLRAGDHLAVVAALAEQPVRVGLLEVAEADLAGGDVRGEGEDGGHGAVGVVEAVDQVQVAGAAGARAGGQLPGDLGLRAGREGGGLLVPHMHPVDAGVAAYGVHDGVEAVADHAVQALDSGADEDVDELLRDVLLGHGCGYPFGSPARGSIGGTGARGSLGQFSQTAAAVRSSA
jgi:hypothetical protein